MSDELKKKIVDTLQPLAERAFCPTGEGGGIDNSCSPNKGSDQTNIVLEKARQAAAMTLGRNADTTVAWVSKSEWGIKLPLAVEQSRVSLGKPAKLQPAIIIIASTRNDGSLSITCLVGEGINSLGKPLPESAKMESIGFEPEFNEQGTLTADSNRRFNKFKAGITTWPEGLSADEAKAFIDGGPIRP